MDLLKVNFQRKKLEYWLESKNNKSNISNTHLDKIVAINDFNLYYDNSYLDIDVKLNDYLEILMIEAGETSFSKKNIEYYSTGQKIFINPFSNRFYPSQLFKLLINYNQNIRDIFYPLNSNKSIKINIFDKTMKEKFYEFCKDNRIK
jgi:hypothetical protein